LTANQSVQLTANVTGGFTQQVTWSLSPAGTGTVSTSGLYVAPTSISSQQTVTVTATSVADATKSAAVVITLTPPTTVSVSPSSASLNVNQALQLTATVTGATNKLVTWTVSGAGSVSTSGLYTAPSVITAQQTVTVTATSAADSTKSASSIVTLVPLTVSLNLAGASLGGAQSQQFAATVTGSANQQVSWSIVPAGLGSISAAGLYTAPALVTSQQHRRFDQVGIRNRHALSGSPIPYTRLRSPAGRTDRTVCRFRELDKQPTGKLEQLACGSRRRFRHRHLHGTRNCEYDADCNIAGHQLGRCHEDRDGHRNS